jgi:uncharacterized membrane protein HdeD (DUF308 family)
VGDGVVAIAVMSLQADFFDTKRRLKMRPVLVIGLILVVLGIVALAIPSFTFFTTERVADAGFFKIDISRPHTIVFNPIVGVVALAVGVVLVISGFRSRDA